MASWAADDSMILSQLLDEVVGTQEMIDARQDYCRMVDCLESKRVQKNFYFTGSKAEGLDLPGSDMDYMHDVNDSDKIKVIQSFDDNALMTSYGVFLMSTENVPAGFTLLQHVHPTLISLSLYRAFQSMNGLRYLSSDLFLQTEFSTMDIVQTFLPGCTAKRQGPSMELRTDPSDDVGTDFVPSIHCCFWPNQANEWVQRPRHFQWPTSHAISTITDFGFHLVPVGHPLSDTKPMEWRISFSLAERTLVWSFNHVQMQCYALLKIILKEFIKVRCNPQNQVLCSYFIKTFLFWKYETSELSFWREDNLKHCIKFLLFEFSKCIQEGVLRHYFIPRFNLLCIKLTRAAQSEILQLFDIIIQCDISILKECRTLHSVWSEFLLVREYPNDAICNVKRKNIVMYDECMMEMADFVYFFLDFYDNVVENSQSLSDTIAKMMRVLKTPLQTLIIGKCFFEKNIRLIWIKCDGFGNKGLYQLHRFAQKNIFSFEISTCKLWYAILLFQNGHFSSTLNIVNQVLSSIPPFAIYYYPYHTTSDEVKRLYADMFLDSDDTIYQRARKAWMFNLRLNKDMIDALPLAFQIELCFRQIEVWISPFTCAYYLQFMCYHQMQRYDERDRALEHLLQALVNLEQRGDPYTVCTSLNIAGHCSLLAGMRTVAQLAFCASIRQMQSIPSFLHCESALWYLQNCF